MEKEDILNLKAGKEIDRMVHKILLGLDEGIIPNYSADISDSWKIVEYFKENQTKIRISGEDWYDGEEWKVEIFDVLGSNVISSVSDVKYFDKDEEKSDICLTICKATLLYYQDSRHHLFDK